MNVNGSRFDLLLGHADWARCLDGDDAAARALAAWWPGATAAPGSPPEPSATGLPAWDGRRAEVTLQPRAIELPATPGESPLAQSARRAADADRNGNVYRISADRRALLVTSSGTRQESAFWPDGPADCGDRRRRARPDFGPTGPAAAAPPESYLALAATCDDYLVVAFAAGAQRGFLTFDLVAGGPPVRTLWPSGIALEPRDMAARPGGGVFLLDVDDAAGRRLLWELDRRLMVVGAAQPEHTPAAPEEDAFQPLSGPAREHLPVALPGGIELGGERAWTVGPIALEVLACGVVLLLDRDDAAGGSRVVRLRRESGAWFAQASRWLDELPDPAHDFVWGNAPYYGEAEPAAQLFITTSRGNQAYAYALAQDAQSFDLLPATELFPLRLYGGRALLTIQGTASYDSGIDVLAWTPIVQQPRARFALTAELVTPVFDSAEVGTTWDRVVLDACLPPDTSLEIDSRSGDECTAGWAAGSASPADAGGQVIGGWMPEPRPHLRGTGPELPWLRQEAAPATRREVGRGSWELLLQHARGRYLQLRLRLVSASGATTPRIRALRVWWPRFSYLHRFLPGVYREDEASASLLDRWLSNCESTLTGIEDRVAQSQLLFDPRIVPVEALAWLAAWLDVALDPAWDERRQRLFLAYAMEFYRWRGTVHGLALVLELAFDACFDEAAFQAPEAPVDGPGRIRIVEAYQTRVIGALAAGDPEATAGPREVPIGTLWTPAEGNAGLVDRWAAALGRKATAVEQIMPFSLVPPAAAGPGAPGTWKAAAGDTAAGDVAAVAQQWSDFTAAVLGFVPGIGAAERALWDRFLATRYDDEAALSRSWGSAYAHFADVPLPPDWPTAAAAEDWTAFCARPDNGWLRERWQDFLARRYRRIERLNAKYATTWPEFDVVALPDALPETAEAQTDWLQFERQVVPMYRTAHRFAVLLPVGDVSADPADLEARLGLARRVVELEKPAHTVFDVRFYWAFFRVGEARLGIDTQMGAGSRAPELIPAAVLGRTYIGASFVGGPQPLAGSDRLRLAC